MTSGIIRAKDCLPQRWKNGLGTTREIAIRKATENAADFLWRVSVAEVDSAAPFSPFPGIDRHIVLLEGSGFDMQLDHLHDHALTTPFEPFAFPGEASVEVTLRGGATRDFNLMVQRHFGSGGIRLVRGGGPCLIDVSCVLVFVARGGIRLGQDRLETGDSWCRHTANSGSVTITLDAAAVALIVYIHPRD